MRVQELSTGVGVEEEEDELLEEELEEVSEELLLEEELCEEDWLLEEDSEDDCEEDSEEEALLSEEELEGSLDSLVEEDGSVEGSEEGSTLSLEEGSLLSLELGSEASEEALELGAKLEMMLLGSTLPQPTKANEAKVRMILELSFIAEPPEPRIRRKGIIAHGHFLHT